MKIKPHKTRVLVLGIGLALLFSTLPALCSDRETVDKIKLNMDAVEHARKLIHEGNTVVDRRGAWAEHQPSAAEENEFIRQRGFEEYAKWHLGIDQRHAENTKARYKFPYGDFRSIHRCALLAARSRARQYSHAEIENAAAELKTLIDAASKQHARR